MISTTYITPFNWWWHRNCHKYEHMYASTRSAPFVVQLTQAEHDSEEPVAWVEWCVNNVTDKFTYRSQIMRGTWFWHFTNEDDAARFKLTWA